MAALGRKLPLDVCPFVGTHAGMTARS